MSSHEPTFSIIGRLEMMKPTDDGCLSIAVTLPTVAEAYVPRVICICRDPALQTKCRRLFTAGRYVRLRGVLEPRRRIIGDVVVDEFVLVLRSGAPLREDWASQ